MKKHPCFGKKTYSNLEQVQQKIMSNYFTNRNAYNYYECPVCLDFHLTSKGKKPIFDNKKVQKYFRLKTAETLIGERVKKMMKSLRTYVKPESLTKRQKKWRKIALSDEEYKKAMWRLKHPILSKLIKKNPQ